MEEKYAVKLTVKFSDGSTENFDTFAAAVAEGLIPAGKDGDGVLYTAGEHLTTRGIACIRTTPDVAVGLIRCLHEIVESVIKNIPPELALPFLKALLTLDGESTVQYLRSESAGLNEG